MMGRQNRKLSFVLAAAALVLAAGCRNTAPPTAVAGSSALTVNRAGGHAASQPDEEAGTAQLLVCSAHDSASASATVGPAGGTIQVGGDRLVVPGGALSTSTLITATVPADTLAEIHFAPHGLHFDKDVILILGTTGCSIGGTAPSHVVYLDNSGNVLETLDGTFNGGSHTVTTKIHHFSSYAIAL